MSESIQIASIPFRGSTVPVAYRRLGQGQPVLLLHGWAHSSRHWLQVSRHLPGFCLYIPDLPGFGQTPSLERAHTSIAAYSELVGAFGDEVLPGGFFGAVGHSLGALCLYTLTHSRPEIARRQVLLDAPLVGIPSLRLLAASTRATKAILTLPRLLPPRYARATIGLCARLTMRHTATGDDADAQDALQMSPITAALLLKALAHWNGTPFSPHCPTLLARGQYDRLISSRRMRLIASAIQATTHQFPAVGHTPHLESPLACASVISEYLGAS